MKDGVITIVDYGMGNIASVRKAFAHLCVESTLTNDRQAIEKAEKLLLPGVGAFGAAMENLKKLRLIEPIREVAQSGRPFFGICLGMQLLMTESEEMGRWRGLDIVSGQVQRFFRADESPPDLKVPHMGWNSLEISGNRSLLTGLPDSSSVYFVHSYHVVPEDTNAIAATCTYGETFCASLAAGNVFGAQFHPEKSGAVGLKILQNFAELRN